MMDMLRIKKLRDFIEKLPEAACVQTIWVGSYPTLGAKARVDLPSGGHVCNTLGCLAGWAAILRRDEERHSIAALRDYNGMQAADEATEWLGLTRHEAQHLFQGHDGGGGMKDDLEFYGRGWKDPMLRVLDELLQGDPVAGVWRRVLDSY